MKPVKEFLDAMAKNPANWRGTFYVNRKDPRLFVPKLNPAMGWTFNFGNIFSYVALLAIILIIVVSQFL